jgi:hypothetical protein
MREVWNSIPNEEKLDITKYGHFSGTGLWSIHSSPRIPL